MRAEVLHKHVVRRRLTLKWDKAFQHYKALTCVLSRLRHGPRIYVQRHDIVFGFLCHSANCILPPAVMPKEFHECDWAAPQPLPRAGPNRPPVLRSNCSSSKKLEISWSLWDLTKFRNCVFQKCWKFRTSLMFLVNLSHSSHAFAFQCHTSSFFWRHVGAYFCELFEGLPWDPGRGTQTFTSKGWSGWCRREDSHSEDSHSECSMPFSGDYSDGQHLLFLKSCPDVHLAKMVKLISQYISMFVSRSSHGHFLAFFGQFGDRTQSQFSVEQIPSIPGAVVPDEWAESSFDWVLRIFVYCPSCFVYEQRSALCFGLSTSVYEIVLAHVLSSILIDFVQWVSTLANITGQKLRKSCLRVRGSCKSKFIISISDWFPFEQFQWPIPISHWNIDNIELKWTACERNLCF